MIKMIPFGPVLTSNLICKKPAPLEGEQVIREGVNGDLLIILLTSSAATLITENCLSGPLNSGKKQKILLLQKNKQTKKPN